MSGCGFLRFFLFRSLSVASMRPMILQMTPYLAVLIGVVATLILVACVIVIVLRSRGHTGEDKRLPKNNGLKPAQENDKSSSVPLKKSIDDLLDGDDKNPDVVPHSSGAPSSTSVFSSFFFSRDSIYSFFYVQSIRSYPRQQPIPYTYISFLLQIL